MISTIRLAEDNDSKACDDSILKIGHYFGFNGVKRGFHR